MSCNQSKIENEEAVSRCKERKQFIKLAVSGRNAFAAAHSAYAVSLKNTGAALSDYGHAELHTTASAVPTTQPTPSTATPVPMKMPPPPPSLIPPPTPLQRAASMPEMIIKVRDNKHMSPKIEEEEDEMMDIDKEELVRKRSASSRGKRLADDDEAAASLQKDRRGQTGELERTRAPPAPAPQNNSTWDYFFNMENMPGPSLAEVADQQEVKVKSEDDRKVFDEMMNGEEEEEVDVDVDVEVEVVVPELSVPNNVEEVAVPEESEDDRKVFDEMMNGEEEEEVDVDVDVDVEVEVVVPELSVPNNVEEVAVPEESEDDRKVFDEMMNGEEEEEVDVDVEVEVVVPELSVPNNVEEVAVPEEMAPKAENVVKKGNTVMGAGPPGVGERKVDGAAVIEERILDELAKREKHGKHCG